MKKKLIITVVSLICVVTMGIGTAIAYFASLSGPVTNTFTVGMVELALAETTGDTYQLIPGATVDKNPVVTVLAGSEACYLYVQLGHTGGLDSYLSYELADGWQLLGGFDGVYYRQISRAAVNMSYHVFKNDQITVKNTLTKEKMATIDEGECVLTVTAYAIQSLGIESPADGWYNILEEMEG